MMREKNSEVELRGTFLHGTEKELPTLIWLPELLEPAENFETFFTRPNNKISRVRNVHLLNYRNFGSSDHHQSFEMKDLAADIIRYMDNNDITMATIGGHGFGAKVAIATATLNLRRFTGVMCLDGGPVDQRYHPAYTSLKKSVNRLASLDLDSMTQSELNKKIDLIVVDKNWNRIFKQNVNVNKGSPQWDFNFEGLHQNMKLRQPDVAAWSESYGLWPGRAWAMIAAHSPWIHLSTNTLPFYDVFPRLQGRFPSNDFNIFGNDKSPECHWMHNSTNESELFHLSNKMWRWLRTKDGVNVLLNDRSEVGWKYIADRGTDSSVGTGQGEYIPEHVHHSYPYTRKCIIERANV